MDPTTHILNRAKRPSDLIVTARCITTREEKAIKPGTFTALVQEKANNVAICAVGTVLGTHITDLTGSVDVTSSWRPSSTRMQTRTLCADQNVV